MPTSRTSSLCTSISREALLDELTKIGEAAEEPKKGFGHALKTMAVGAGGTALGSGLAEVVGRNLSFFQPPPGGDAAVFSKRLRTARIILPILGGTAAMLADRYRQKMNEQYSKVRGFQDRSKR